MDTCDFENMLNEISDEDVAAALREMKARFSLKAAELKKICLGACLHSRARGASSLRVKDAMTRNVLAVSKYDDISRAVRTLADKNISGLPVLDRESRVVGIISEADVVSMVGADRNHTFKDLVRQALGHHIPERKRGHIVGDIMTAPAITITSETEISEVVCLMDERRIRRLPVVDDDGRLIGILSRSDILKAIGKKLATVETDDMVP